MRWLRSRATGLAAAALGVALVLPGAAHAWWNADFKQRTRITLNTSAAGVETREALSDVVVPVRLHSGNFDFLAAKPDGADLRFVAGDDKTPLRFSIERFDSNNELAVVWVQVPLVAPGSDKNYLYAYAGNPAAAAEPAATVVDAATVAAFRFADRDGTARDHTGTLASTAPVALEVNGLIGSSARFDGNAAAEWPASDKLKSAPGAPRSISLWVKPATAGGVLVSQGALVLELVDGRLQARLGSTRVAGGELPVSAWAHVGLTLGGGKATLYVNGTQAAQADVPNPAPGIEGPLRVAERYSGELDELQIANVQRSAEWMKFARAAQGADAKLIAAVKQLDGEVAEGEAAPGYMGILVKNLTIDAWVVIVILGLMFVHACWVVVVKTLLVQRQQKGNDAFVARFRDADDVLGVAGVDQYPNSSLARLFDAGKKQLVKRGVGSDAQPLSGAALDAVKAAVDADLVRENHKLNSLMVYLTIAISGGPFLGLLGTVVGVMITFAAIAAAGDVNVNAIAPGIAAALLATVAGLAVAIPALFAYNYLASRIKNLSSDMQIFVDEFVTRVAERYGQR